MALKTSPISFRRPLRDTHPWAIIRHFLFGHPLKTSSQYKETLGFILGLPLLAIDALSSVAYATEEILIALSVAGTSLYGLSIPIAFTIIILLAALTTSYIQTVQAYPDGGGAYTISKNHLGSMASLIAASSLLIDYTLTVAVSVTAGVRAITSAYPTLIEHNIQLSLLGILFLTWINLRGLKESAKFIAPFVYVFIGCLLIMGGKGVAISWTSSLTMNSFSPNIQNSYLLDLAFIPIILRAFAGGCTAMTGIEAIANAGSMLDKPHATIAKHILLALGLILGTLFLMITYLAFDLGLKPLENESILSQITRTLWGDGFIHEFIQMTTAIILFLAANTAFAGAPKLSAMLAHDGWLPKQLSIVGDRLVFSKGIVILALMATFLIILFKGQTHLLIPLYAIGVFTAFTLSQAGMVRYWAQQKNSNKGIHNSLKGFINGLGALLTCTALIVTFEAKFREGAFLILLAIPLIIIFCIWIKRHYTQVSLQLNLNPVSLESKQVKSYIPALSGMHNRPVIIPIYRLHRGSLSAISFAKEISNDVRIVIIDLERHNALKTEADVKSLKWDLQIVHLSSPYRSIIRPIIEYVHQVDDESQKLSTLILVEIIPLHWWENILHNKTSQNIVRALAWSEALESQARIIINVPYYLQS